MPRPRPHVVSAEAKSENTLFMPAILGRLAGRLGAEVLLEPEFRVVGRIRFKNGRQSYFWHNKFNLNSVSSARIAADKGYTSFFLEAEGIRVPKTQTFFEARRCRILKSSRNLERACEFAKEIGWPVYLKPCRGSQGAGIELAATPDELRAIAARIFRKTHTLLVQEACFGKDYRLVVLDGEVISAYERVPLGVIGDGTSSVHELLAAKQREFDASGRDTRIDFSDVRIKAALRRARLTGASVLPRGRALRLLEVANLSCGGTSIDVTAQVHPRFARLAARICRGLDLRLAGVDLIAPDITKYSKIYWVLEVNSAPGLDHYAASGPAHEAAIDDLYFKVLRAIKRGRS